MAESRMVRQWFAYAARDLKLAAGAIGYGPQFKNEAAFHAQQCIEKAMKGFLISRGVRPPKTHNIEHLTGLVSGTGVKLKSLIRNPGRVTEYAVVYRYPDADVKPISFKTAKAAVAQARTVYDFLLKTLASD